MLYSQAVITRRDAGNAAVKAGRMQDADKSYSDSLKAAKVEIAGSQHDASACGGEGVALWALYSNRSLARLRLRLPDQALGDALAAHSCAQMQDIRPFVRCADAFVAMGMHQEARNVLKAAEGCESSDGAAIAEKIFAIEQQPILRVGRGELYSSIRAAVIAAPPGAEILVTAGIYKEPLLLCKPVTIRSLASFPDEYSGQCPPEGGLAEIRVSESMFHAVTVACADGAVRLQGFQIVTQAPFEGCRHALIVQGGLVVIQNCALTSSSGPVLCADQNARVIGEHCAIYNGAQGGILAASYSALVLRNVFTCHCAATGLELRLGATATMDLCSVFGNGKQGVMVWHGAGAFHATRSEVHSHKQESGVLVEENQQAAVFKSCHIYGNNFAGAVVQKKGRMRLVQCKVHSNLEGVLVQESGTSFIESCEIYGNKATGIFIGYDHTGTASLVKNIVRDNHCHGILLGTGRNDRVTLCDNVERGNLGRPPMTMPASFSNGDSRDQKMKSRQWAKSVKKSGGSAAKAAAASNDMPPFFRMAAERMEADFGKTEDLILACGFCKKPESDISGHKKFLKCAKCLVVSYCSAKCQTAHWKAGHKKECTEPLPAFPSFMNKEVSVDHRQRMQLHGVSHDSAVHDCPVS